MHYKAPKNKDEILLFQSYEQWISKNNPVRLLDLLIDKIVSSNPDKFIWKGQSATGCKSYSPATMLKLLMYGYLNNIAGSRRLEKESYRNIELLWLLGELHPDHWTICEYRRMNKDQVRLATIKFREFLKSENYIDGKTVAIDGSKLKAYTSREMLSMQAIEQRLSKVNEKLEQYLDEFQRTDSIEELTEELESLTGNDEINTALVDKIIELQSKIEELELQKKQLEESGKKYISLNDVDANLMRSRDGKIPAYNAQVGVDGKNKMILLSEITTEVSDINLLKEDVDKMKEQMDIEPEVIEADKGYANTCEIKEVESNNKTECYIPLPDNNHKKKDEKNGIEFKYDKDKDEYVCSQGRILKLKARNKKKRGHYYNVYQGIDCIGCPLREKCTSSKTGRILHIATDKEWIDIYKERLKKAGAKAKIRERKKIVEHVFGSLKWMMENLILY